MRPPSMVSDISFVKQTPGHSDQSGPLLLFLPGIDGTGGAGATQWARLAPLYDVHSFCCSVDDRSTFDESVQACTEFLDDHPRRAALLVGESTGAVLALEVALRTPSRVSALCLVNPATSYAGSPLSSLAPLLPSLPRPIYEATPGIIAPLFGKPNWFRTIVRSPRATAPLLPTPTDLLAAGAALADILPPAALAHRLQAHLTDGARQVNERLADASSMAKLSSTGALLIAGGRDVILPSVRETERLEQILRKSSCKLVERKVLPDASHACMDDTRSLNLRLELELSGVTALVQKAHRSMQEEATEALDEAAEPAASPTGLTVDPSPQSPFEGWLQQMRRIFSPLFYTVREDGSLSRGLQSLSLPDGPILLVGNHQLYGFDGPMLIEEMLKERGVAIRPLVFPPLLEEVSPLAPFPYPLPGTKQTFERFGALPASARTLYRSLAANECVMLFPGGAREVFKRKGEEYKIFWPDDPDFVRLAARVNATLIPFSGIGGDESFSMVLDSDELLNTPAVGDFFRERIDALPSLVADDKFVPPFGTLTPRRHYFAFGKPISTVELRADDRESCASVYAELREQVSGGTVRLREEVRAADPYSELLKRSAWEALYDAQAPGPAELEA